MSDDYCGGCNGKVPGIIFSPNSEDEKVYVERCLDCCRFRNNRMAAEHVSSLTWWRVYSEGTNCYFLITVQEALDFQRRNRVTLEEPERDDEDNDCDDCRAAVDGTCSDHCRACNDGEECDINHEREDE